MTKTQHSDSGGRYHILELLGPLRGTATVMMFNGRSVTPAYSGATRKDPAETYATWQKWALCSHFHIHTTVLSSDWRMQIRCLLAYWQTILIILIYPLREHPCWICKASTRGITAKSYLDIVRSWEHSGVLFPRLKLSSEHQSPRHRVKASVLKDEYHAISYHK